MRVSTDRTKRNLNPHKWAVAAMWLFGKEYSVQMGGQHGLLGRSSAEQKTLGEGSGERDQPSPGRSVKNSYSYSAKEI